MDIVKNGFNAVKTLTVTDFLKVNGVSRDFDLFLEHSHFGCINRWSHEILNFSAYNDK